MWHEAVAVFSVNKNRGVALFHITGINLLEEESSANNFRLTKFLITKFRPYEQGGSTEHEVAHPKSIPKKYEHVSTKTEINGYNVARHLAV
jgi:hypothetical protein